MTVVDPSGRERPVPLSGLGALPFPLTAAAPPALTLLALIVGGVLHLFDRTQAWSAPLLFGALVLFGAPVVFRTLRGLLRGKFAADVVAMLAIVTAIVLREPVAGLVIVLMQTGGELLERYAEGRASAAVRELEAAAPRVAHRFAGGVLDTAPEDVAADQIVANDLVLVRPGEMVPCDGTVIEGSSSLDTSRVTGEPVPERVKPGAAVRSGVVNLEGPLILRVTAPASESLYARIVDLVRTAQSEKAPIQRLADRWAVWFTPITLLACAVAWWLSGDPARVLAVLVVATPCPLLLATPVAVIGGINRAARLGIIVRNGTALELLARVDTAVFDKTGTLTIGRPAVASVVTTESVTDGATDGAATDELLALAAAVEVGSGHHLARTTVDEARRRGLAPLRAEGIVEHAGRGVTGRVGTRTITVGSLALVRELHPKAAAGLHALHARTSGLRAYVAADDRLLGAISYSDRPREGLTELFARLHELGLTRLVLLSGDHVEHVRPVAAALGIDDARGDLLPQDKVEAVRALENEGRTVLMVGDGTNDAPALSAATVGVALAAHGGGISAEAAGVVLLADDLARTADAVEIGQRAVRIARQSIGVGLALSGFFMVVAALGYIPPTLGALLQEAVDITVILNALRAARG